MKYRAYILTALCVCLSFVLAACGGPGKDIPSAKTGTSTTTTPPPTTPTKTETPSTPATPPATPATPDKPATPAPDKPAATTPAATATYKITADDSSIGFIGYNMIGGREGGFAKFDGTVVVDGGNLETAKIDLNIDTTSVFSDSEILTGKLKTDHGFFEVDKFPKATFKSSKVAKTDKGYEVTGDLNLHGVSKSITFPATIAVNGKELTAKTEFKVNRHDWQIEYSATGDFAVKDECVIRFEIKSQAS